MIQINANFDWVTARANCSANAVFKVLEHQVKCDVDTRNSLLTAMEMQYFVRFLFQSSVKAFQVLRLRDTERLDSVTFEQIPNGIKVLYKDGMSIAGVLTLSNDGECRLKVKDVEEYTSWQFRKLILEPIFFSNNLDW